LFLKTRHTAWMLAVKSRFSKESEKIQLVLWAFVGLALFSAAWLGLEGSSSFTLWKAEVFGSLVSIGFRVDLVSVLLFLMTSVLGAVIGRYSLSYLKGEGRQIYFFRFLLLTLLSVFVFVTASNLLMLFGAWLASSFGIHQLLLYYPHRPAAQMAAKKKFVISRIGDLAVLGGIILTYRTFGTFELEELFRAIQSMSVDSRAWELSGISLLFSGGALIKSAQFPLHFWLPETMEAPTPVSALMHAGIINGGGILLIKLSPLLQFSSAAAVLLTSVGSLTAVFGTLVMITQNDIKKKLAYSTISQMGMMIFCCGLGAFSLALFHIIAHSFYKAHAFLSTGLLVDESRKSNLEDARIPLLPLGLISLWGLALIVAGSFLFGGKFFAYFTYAAILCLGLFQNLNFGPRSYEYWSFASWLRVSGVLALAIFIFAIAEFFIWQGMAPLYSTSAVDLKWSGAQPIAGIGGYLVFVLGLWLTQVMVAQRSPWAERCYLYFWNGGYFYQRTYRLFR